MEEGPPSSAVETRSGTVSFCRSLSHSPFLTESSHVCSLGAVQVDRNKFNRKESIKILRGGSGPPPITQDEERGERRKEREERERRGGREGEREGGRDS